MAFVACCIVILTKHYLLIFILFNKLHYLIEIDDCILQKNNYFSILIILNFMKLYHYITQNKPNYGGGGSIENWDFVS